MSSTMKSALLVPYLFSITSEGLVKSPLPPNVPVPEICVHSFAVPVAIWSHPEPLPEQTVILNSPSSVALTHILPVYVCPFSTLPSRDWIAPASEDVRSVTLKAPLPPCTSSAVTAMDDAELFHTVPDFQPLRSSSNPPLTTNSTGSSADAAVTPIVAGNTAPMQHSTDAAAAATTRPVFLVCNM